MNTQERGMFVRRAEAAPRLIAASRGGEVRPIGDILAELLALYQDRYPEAQVVVVQTPARR